MIIDIKSFKKISEARNSMEKEHELEEILEELVFIVFGIKY